MYSHDVLIIKFIVRGEARSRVRARDGLELGEGWKSSAEWYFVDIREWHAQKRWFFGSILDSSFHSDSLLWNSSHISRWPYKHTNMQNLPRLTASLASCNLSTSIFSFILVHFLSLSLSLSFFFFLTQFPFSCSLFRRCWGQTASQKILCTANPKKCFHGAKVKPLALERAVRIVFSLFLFWFYDASSHLSVLMISLWHVSFEWK